MAGKASSPLPYHYDMRRKTEIKKYLSSKIAVICTSGFILIALLLAADEILDIPFHVFNAPPTPINWVEIGIEVFFVLMVGVFTVFYISKLDLGRKQAEDELRKTRDYLNSLLQYANAPIIVWDTKQRVTMFNTAFERLTGYKAGEVIGQPLGMLFPEASRDESLSKIASTLKGEYWESVEIPILRKDGDVRTVLWNSANIYDKDGKTLLATIAQGQDITERKQAEEELEKYRKHLEELVEERTSEVEQANVRLQELDRLKSVFLASMSHELRTPLNSIIGFTGIILQGMSGEVNEEQRKQLTMVKNSASHLLSLINDVLDISKIEAGKVELSLGEFSLDDVVREVVETVSSVVSEKGLELTTKVPEGITLLSDKRHIKQVLLNLVSNAVKFTDRGSLNIAARVLRDENLEIRVTDTGIGIQNEDMDKLFQPFQQISAPLAKSREGTGLGLYISKKLAALLGGDISARSEYGRGSEFTFIVPLRYEEAKRNESR